MTDVAIKWVAKGKTRLPEAADKLSWPLQEVAKMLIPIMGRRVKLGVSPSGHWAAMGKNPEKPGRGLWWVAPGTPQPAGALVNVTSGPWQGWAGYASYHAWLKARGILGQPRNFNETGEMWDALRFRVLGAANVRIAFYGKHMYRPPPIPEGGGKTAWQQRAGTRVKPANADKRGKAKFYSNAEIAWLASRNEADPMLMPTREEVQQIMVLFQNNMAAQLTELSAEGGAVAKLASRATALEKRRTSLEMGRR